MFCVRFEHLGRVVYANCGSRSEAKTVARGLALGFRGVPVSVWCAETCVDVFTFNA